MDHRRFRQTLALVFLWGAVPIAMAQDLPPTCQRDPGAAQDSLTRAESFFLLNLYDEAIKVLEPCRSALDEASEALNNADKRRALRLLAIAYNESEEPDSVLARHAARQLVREIDRDYPDGSLDDPLYLRRWVAEFRQELRKELRRRRWVQIGVGAIAGVLGFILLQESSSDPVAGPPVFPPPSQ